MPNSKHIIYSSILSAVFSPILLIIYYFMYYIPLTKEVGSLLGHTIGFELILVFVIIFTLTLPLSFGLFLYVDYNTGTIYQKKWMSVTLVKKYKKFMSTINPRGGSGLNEYRYWFDFRDEDDNMFTFYGSTYEYECLIEGAKIQINVKGLMIKEIALIEE